MQEAASCIPQRAVGMQSACQPVCSVPNYIFNSNVWGEATEEHQDSCDKVYIIYLMLLEKQRMLRVIAKTSKDSFPITGSEAKCSQIYR